MKEVIQSDIFSLSFSDPFYLVFLMSTKISYSDEVTTYVIQLEQNNISFKINRTWYESKVSDVRSNIIKQAILHVVLLHWYYEEDYHNDFKRFLIACEIQANCYIDLPYRTSTIIDPKTDITVERINSMFGLQLEEKKDFIYYYENLIGQDLSNIECPNQGMTYGKGLSVFDKEISLSNTKGNIESAKGNLPSSAKLNSYLKEFLGRFEILPPKVSWNSYLRNFLTRYGKKVRPEASRTKVNKIFRDRVGQKHTFIGSVLVIIDTSGSITKEEYKKFISEITHMSKKYKIYIVHCDSDIRYGPKLFNKDSDEQYTIHGKGGTLFNPAIDLFNKSEHSVCVYFTDTYNGDKELIQPLKPIIWIDTGKHGGAHLAKLKHSQIIKLE